MPKYDEYGIPSTFILENLEITVGEWSTVRGLEKLDPKLVDKAIKEALSLAAKTLQKYIMGNITNSPAGNLKWLAQSIKIKELKRNTVYVGSSHKHIKYYEFGTGIVGASSPHTEIMEEYGWEHDVHGHGNKGWVAPKDQFDPQRYKLKIGKNAYWTKGMPAGNFFQDAIDQFKSHGTLIAAMKAKLYEVYK